MAPRHHSSSPHASAVFFGGCLVWIAEEKNAGRVTGIAAFGRRAASTA